MVDERSTDDCLEALFDLGNFGGGAGGGLALSVLMNLSVLVMVGFSVVVGATGVGIGGAVEFRDWASAGASKSLEYTSFPTIVRIVPKIIQPSKSIANVSIAPAPG